MKGMHRAVVTPAGISWAASVLTIVAWVLGSPEASAQELKAEDVRTHRPSFDFEQCANACQIELDKAASSCIASADSEAKAAEMGVCAEKATDRNRSCQKVCPPDTGE